MTSSHGYPPQGYWDDTVYDTRPSFLDGFQLSVDPSERYGAPAPRPSTSQMVSRFLCAAILSGAWLAFAVYGGVERYGPTVQAAVGTVLDKAADLAARFEKPASPEIAANQTEAASMLQNATPPLPEIAVAPISSPEPVEAAGTDYVEKAPPADDAEAKAIAPQRKKAAAAGLGVDLPNVLLSRLSKVDFQNAAYAVKTALAKTADDAKFSWPSKPTREQALFEVRFVTGAPSGCRRYVVTVTKDRWSSNTTALEKCGAVLARAN